MGSLGRYYDEFSGDDDHDDDCNVHDDSGN